MPQSLVLLHVLSGILKGCLDMLVEGRENFAYTNESYVLEAFSMTSVIFAGFRLSFQCACSLKHEH